jgi:tRNA A22 N-methylase
VVRKTLLELGLAIIDEDMIYEDGHYYTLIIAITDTKEVAYLPYSPNENPLYFVYGKCLVTKKHPLLMEQLEMKNTRDTQLIAILKEKGIINRIAELEHDIAIRKKVIKWMQ